jgi:hypothetical protein
MVPSKPSLNATYFSFDRRRRLIVALVIGIGCLGFILYVGILRDASPSDILGTLVIMGFFSWTTINIIRQLRAFDDRVAVDDLGVWYLPSRGADTLVKWGDIAGVKQHNMVTKHLRIIDRNGSVKIKLVNQLENSDTFKRLIHEHTNIQMT